MHSVITCFEMESINKIDLCMHGILWAGARAVVINEAIVESSFQSMYPSKIPRDNLFYLWYTSHSS